MNELTSNFNNLSEKEQIEFIKSIVPQIESLVKNNKNDLMREFSPVIDKFLEQYGMTMDQIMMMLQMFNPQN